MPQASLHALHAVRLHELQHTLAKAPHGAKGDVMAQAAREMGLAPASLYRLLGQHLRPRIGAAASSRKRRVDAGQRSADRAELESISAALLASFRRSGQRILSVESALEMLRDNGVVKCTLSTGRICTLLTEHGLHPAQLTRPEPAIEQRSLHPNHVWQVDASICVAYYLSNATGLQVADERLFYKNKPGALTRIQNERLVRYAIADHYTHQVLVRYYLGSESAANLTDFLIWAFAPKAGHLMHGVPFILQMDMGSANTSAATLTLLDRLQVRVIVHERHNSRANGSVEKAHHLVETGFESGLRFARVASLDDLNDKALIWANHFGANRLHSRYGSTRHELWMSIMPDQLRLAPPVDLMRELPTTHPVAVRVSNNLTATHRGHDYDLRYLPGVMAGSKVNVVINALRAPAIQAEYVEPETGEVAWLTIEPIERGADGRRVDAPVIGEQMRAAPRGLLEHNRDAVMARAFGPAAEDAQKTAQKTAQEGAQKPATARERAQAASLAQEKGALAFQGRVDPFKRAAEAQLPAYLPRRGTTLEAPRREVAAPRITPVAASKRIREALLRLGAGEQFGPQVLAWLQQRYGAAGVPEDQIDGLVAQFTQRAAEAAAPAAPAAAPAPLRAVGGA